jgi:hypothetical protein
VQDIKNFSVTETDLQEWAWSLVTDPNPRAVELIDKIFLASGKVNPNMPVCYFGSNIIEATYLIAGCQLYHGNYNVEVLEQNPFAVFVTTEGKLLGVSV